MLNITTKEKWKIDNKKIETAIDNGYMVFVVWESDFRNNPNKIIKDSINFLNS